MISSFLKKLLFARQLTMSDGTIEVLGKKHVMLPSDIVVALQSLDEKRYYDVIKKGIHQNMGDYTRRIGTTSSGIVKITEDIFETFGLGKPEIVLLDNKKKSAIVRFHKPPMADACAAQNFEECILLPAALAGMFSFIFGKDVNVQVQKCEPKQAMMEYVVR
ncbi:MAG: hypothetical protein AABY13_00855 [Nanoarchaeota archaeon]